MLNQNNATPSVEQKSKKIDEEITSLAIKVDWK